MDAEILKYLYDIKDAASAILEFVHGKSYDDYRDDELLKSGVERKFEIIGEALNKIRRINPQLLNRIRDHRSIISFRNILAHEYNSIDHTIVWGIIQENLDNLYTDVEKLLVDHEPESPDE